MDYDAEGTHKGASLTPGAASLLISYNSSKSQISLDSRFKSHHSHPLFNLSIPIIPFYLSMHHNLSNSNIMEGGIEFNLEAIATGLAELPVGSGPTNAPQLSQEEHTSSLTVNTTLELNPDQESRSIQVNSSLVEPPDNLWYVPPADATVCPADLSNPSRVPDYTPVALGTDGAVKSAHTVEANSAVNNSGGNGAVDSSTNDAMEPDMDTGSTDDYDENDYVDKSYFDDEDDLEDGGALISDTGDTGTETIIDDSDQEKTSPRQAQLACYHSRKFERLRKPLFMRSRVYTRSPLARELKLVSVLTPDGSPMWILAWEVHSGKGVQGDNTPHDSFCGNGKKYCKSCGGVCRWKGMMPRSKVRVGE